MQKQRVAPPTKSCDDSAYGTLTAEDEDCLTTQQLAAESRRQSFGSTAETQLKYNHDSHEISRSISEAIKVASAFKVQSTNADWPMQVPLTDVQKQNRPICARTATATDAQTHAPNDFRRQALKRASTSLQPDVATTTTATTETDDTPCVLSPEVNRRLQILRPEIMMGAHEENIIHTMNPQAVGEIMEQQFIKVQKHLNKLQVRVEDISSKVLVTGDLNAGKSTLCNALLRRRVLPTDQQPCTEVFCEILDARENEHVSEVHAVSHDATYDREDSSSYTRLSYADLETVVLEPSKYSALKVYVDDQRPLSESLLHNGVVDISLIDAPGLNSDSVQTTAVYARQEEIDVIVFVVSAENHFTLSAKQFLWNASNEKAYLFIVVNRFDNIKDKDRCRRIILEQVAKLSPSTYADASELVHFVSADSVLEQPTPEQRAEAFTELEIQLRNFVLNKRSQSKLAPAKNFVSKFWADSAAIASHNCDIALEEQSKLKLDLLNRTDRLDTMSKEKQAAFDHVTSQKEAIIHQVQTATKGRIIKATNSLSNLVPERAYAGVFDAYSYACALRDQYLKSILSATIESEMSCRGATSQGIDVIRKIGMSHLKDEYKLKPFNAAYMFSRKRDAIQRNLPVDLHALDFVDCAKFEAVVGTSSLSAALLLYGGKTLGWSAMVDTSLRLLNVVGIQRTPKLMGLLAIVAVGGISVYVTLQIPQALQKNLSHKIKSTVESLDYAGTNANRIANECRTVLQIPETDLRVAFNTKVQAEEQAKHDIDKQLLATNTTIKFFQRHNLIISREEKRLEHIVL